MSYYFKDEVKREYGEVEDNEEYPYMERPSYLNEEDYDRMADSENGDDIGREQLIRYLYGEDNEEEPPSYYQEDEENSLQQYPGEEYLEPQSDEALEYEMDIGNERPRVINYNGQEGYFIPIDKRQYMSYEPAQEKRFYEEEPEVGRWSALIAERERRSEQNMSERLYRLARALGGDQEYDDNEYLTRK